MVNIENLSFAYGRKRKLFEHLNLKLKGGHIYGLLGKNGAGKSTLLKAITGLVFPQNGSCCINGINTSLRLPAMVWDLYLVPEELYVPPVTISAYVKSTAPFYPGFSNSLFLRYLDKFEVPQDSVLTRLSFGQQKKVFIAFGLACCTSLLVMDEPTNGLDIPSKSQFRKIVASAFGEGQCIVISTHQVRDLDNLIDSIIVLHEGRIILNDNVDEIAERISFKTLSVEEQQDALYYESTVRGLEGIVPNNGEPGTKVNIELLFNAVIEENTKVLPLIGNHYERYV